MTVNAAACDSPPSGMVVWLPGDGNADDVSGNGHNGTLQSGATFTTGKVNQAFSFNGSGAYVSVPDSADQQSASFSVDAWVNPNNSGGADGVIASKYDGNYHGWILAATPTGTVEFALYRDSLNTNSTSAPVPLNTWSHITGTYDGSTISLFVNGTLVWSSNKPTGARPGRALRLPPKS